MSDEQNVLEFYSGLGSFALSRQGIVTSKSFAPKLYLLNCTHRPLLSGIQDSVMYLILGRD